jgi:excisionase family DNA binding protein
MADQVTTAVRPGRERGKKSFRDEMLTAQDLAELLHINITTIYDWRHRGTGPRAIRPAGGNLLFRRADVDTWLEQYADAAGTA